MCRSATASCSKGSAVSGRISISSLGNALADDARHCAPEWWRRTSESAHRHQVEANQSVQRGLGRERMPELRFPSLLPAEPRKKSSRTCAAHRAWVRRHRCSVPGCRNLPIECAHVRSGTDAGIGLKPSDKWCVSLCRNHHLEQHEIGERAFELQHGIDLRALASEFARRSPHRGKLSTMCSETA